MKWFFFDWGWHSKDYNTLSVKNLLCVVGICRFNHPLWKNHGLSEINFDSFTIDKSNQVKISCSARATFIVLETRLDNLSIYKEPCLYIIICLRDTYAQIWWFLIHLPPLYAFVPFKKTPTPSYVLHTFFTPLPQKAKSFFILKYDVISNSDLSKIWSSRSTKDSVDTCRTVTK